MVSGVLLLTQLPPLFGMFRRASRTGNKSGLQSTKHTAATHPVISTESRTFGTSGEICRVELKHNHTWFLYHAFPIFKSMSAPNRYEILEGLPPSGPMYICVSKSGATFYNEGYVIHFYRTDGTNWVANFNAGETDLKGVYELKASDNLLVIAKGECYIMHPDNQMPISVFRHNYSKLLMAEDGRYVLLGDVDITIVETDGTYWHSEQLSLDRIEDVKLEGNVISGITNNFIEDSEEWNAFTYNIDTKEVTGNTYLRRENDRNKKR